MSQSRHDRPEEPLRVGPSVERKDRGGPDALGALAPVGLGFASLDGIVRSCNDALARLLGCDEAASLAGSDLRSFHTDPDLATEILRDRLEGGRVRGLELEVRRRDGSTTVVRLDAEVQAGGGAEAGVHFAALELEGRESPGTRSHTQKMEAIERFAAGVAHDYNNLLTAIIGEAGQLLDDLPTSAHAHEGARSILQSAKRAAEITRRLLVFSRAEAGSPASADLNRLVRLAAQPLRDDLPDGVELLSRLDPDLARAWIDPEHLSTILTHLVRNAGEAMPEGGRVAIETTMVRAPTDTAGIDFHPPVPSGDYVSFAVGDTGPGMDGTTRSRIFDPFFTTKEPGDGAGLGLTTVYGLVLRASGHLAVISAPAWGTLVRVLLPVRTRHAAVAGSVAPVSAPRPQTVGLTGGPKRILVVDDESAVLRVIARVLRRAGYIVVQAGNGYDAQDEIRRQGRGLDLVISDVMMPRMKGTELVRWLRARSSDTPVLLLSGYADASLVRDLVEADPGSFLPKPFEPDELLERVRERLGEGERA